MFSKAYSQAHYWLGCPSLVNSSASAIMAACSSFSSLLPALERPLKLHRVPPLDLQKQSWSHLIRDRGQDFKQNLCWSYHGKRCTSLKLSINNHSTMNGWAGSTQWFDLHIYNLTCTEVPLRGATAAAPFQWKHLQRALSAFFSFSLCGLEPESRWQSTPLEEWLMKSVNFFSP